MKKVCWKVSSWLSFKKWQGMAFVYTWGLKWKKNNSKIAKKIWLTFDRVSGILPTGQLSNVPWRRTGVKYANNEAYFDVIEEIDCILDKSGSTVIAEIQGYVSITWSVYYIVYFKIFSYNRSYWLKSF